MIRPFLFPKQAAEEAPAFGVGPAETVFPERVDGFPGFGRGGGGAEKGMAGEGGGDNGGEALPAFGESVLVAGEKIDLGGIGAVDDLDGKIDSAEAAGVEDAGGMAPGEAGDGAVPFEGVEGDVCLGAEGGHEDGAGTEFGAFVEELDGGLDGAGGRFGADLLLEEGGLGR